MSELPPKRPPVATAEFRNLPDRESRAVLLVAKGYSKRAAAAYARQPKTTFLRTLKARAAGRTPHKRGRQSKLEPDEDEALVNWVIQYKETESESPTIDEVLAEVRFSVHLKNNFRSFCMFFSQTSQRRSVLSSKGSGQDHRTVFLNLKSPGCTTTCPRTQSLKQPQHVSLRLYASSALLQPVIY